MVVENLLSPGDTAARVGENFEFSCTASGIPAPQISWSKDNLPLTTEFTNITERRFSNDSSYFTVSVLNLCDLQFSDSGQYSCIASNNISSDTSSFGLEAQGQFTVSQ